MCEDLVMKKNKKSLVTQSLETISNLTTKRKVLKISYYFGHIICSFLCMGEFRHRGGGVSIISIWHTVLEDRISLKWRYIRQKTFLFSYLIVDSTCEYILCPHPKTKYKKNLKFKKKSLFCMCNYINVLTDYVSLSLYEGIVLV